MRNTDKLKISRDEHRELELRGSESVKVKAVKAVSVALALTKATSSDRGKLALVVSFHSKRIKTF